MHVVVNAQLVHPAGSYRSAGVSNYSRNLLAALGRQTLAPERAGELRISAFTGDANFRTPGVEVYDGSAAARRPLVRIAWEQTILPLALERLAPDVHHGLVNVLPLAARAPAVVTVHDLSFVRVPEKMPLARRLYMTGLCRAAVAKARRVIAVSRQTAGDLMHYFDAPADKIEVIHNGVESRFRPGQAAAAAAFRQAKGLPERFFLFVGTLEPRKNLELLLNAFARFRAVAGHEDIKLVMAGGRGWFFEDIFRRVRELDLEAHVLFPGFVDDAELPDWYRAALAFVYPSLFEGFGLPVLEAMACGAPVLCSRAGSLLEIAGDAALTASATDRDDWVAAMSLLANQEDARALLARRGRARAEGFSWDATAAHTVEVYRMAAVGR